MKREKIEIVSKIRQEEKQERMNQRIKFDNPKAAETKEATDKVK